MTSQLYICNRAIETCPDECHRDPHPYVDKAPLTGGCDSGICHNEHIEGTVKCIPTEKPASDAQAEIDALVTAARDALRVLDYEASQGRIDPHANGELRAALAPFEMKS